MSNFVIDGNKFININDVDFINTPRVERIELLIIEGDTTTYRWDFHLISSQECYSPDFSSKEEAINWLTNLST